MKKLKGAYTALITPFKAGTIDEEGLKILIRRQLEHGIDGIVILGSTGEASTLSDEEKISVIKCARQEIKNKPLIVGAGTNCTKKTVEFCKTAQIFGADILMVSPPYYNKPTQQGLIYHFDEILKAIEIPLLIYNNPGRTGVNLKPSTLCELAKNPKVSGVKEASGSLEQMQEIIELISKHRPEFSILSGDDSLTFNLMSLGGDGVISVVSNLFPESIKKLVDQFFEGNFVRARETHYFLSPLFRGLFIETNPIPIKTALQSFNLPSGDLRLPLCEMKDENSQTLIKLLENYRNVS